MSTVLILVERQAKGEIEDIRLNYVMFIIVQFGIGLFNKQFPTKIASLN